MEIVKHNISFWDAFFFSPAFVMIMLLFIVLIAFTRVKDKSHYKVIITTIFLFFVVTLTTQIYLAYTVKSDYYNIEVKGSSKVYDVVETSDNKMIVLKDNKQRILLPVNKDVKVENNDIIKLNNKSETRMKKKDFDNSKDILLDELSNVKYTIKNK